MTRFAFASLKASPGATTLVQALALSWPAGHGVLVVEADPAGGDLAARLELPAEPGLVSVAAAGRRGLTGEALLEHVQEASSTTGLLVGPASARQARGALELLGDRLPTVLGEVVGLDVLVDCGRLDPGSPALPLVRAAELVILVARPTVTEVAHLAAGVDELRQDNPSLALVLVGEPFPGARHLYPAEEVAASVGVEVVGTVADDARTAGVLAGHRRGERLLARSELLRSARQLAVALCDRAGRDAAEDLPPLAPMQAVGSMSSAGGNGHGGAS